MRTIFDNVTAATVTVPTAVSALLRGDASGTIATTALQSNFSLPAGTLSLSNALTSINSITSVAGANLALALGTGGTALTFTTSTLAATFAGTITCNAIGTSTFSGPISAGGPITSTSTADGVFIATQASTAAKSIQLGNTGGSVYFGMQNAAGDFFFGAPAYSAVIYSPSNSVYIRTTAVATNGTLSVGGNLTVSGTGTQLIAGTLSVTGSGTNSFTGAITTAGTVTATTTSDEPFAATTAGAGARTLHLQNTGGNVYFGIQNNAGDYFFGVPANNSAIYSPANPIYLRTSSTTTTNGQLITLSSTSSTSTTTGALIVSGGAGIGGRLNVGGDLVAGLSATAVSLGTNNTFTFELTSNTTLSVKVRGSDGTTRTGTVSLS